MPFGLKIPNGLGKMSENDTGDFLTHSHSVGYWAGNRRFRVTSSVHVTLAPYKLFLLTYFIILMLVYPGPLTSTP